jgi:Domain of unknown function DUF11
MKQMTRIGTILLIAIVLGFGAVPAVQAQDGAEADLALDKILFQAGEPLFAGDQAIWNLSLTNNGPDDATGIQVTEDMSGLGLFTLDRVEAGEGTTFENPVWSIPVLANGASVTLNLTTKVAGEGDLVNRATITAMDQEDSDPSNDQASASTSVGQSIKAEIEVKPETLNLGSRGVFTVFIRFGGDYPLDAVNLEESSLVCNGAEPEKLHVTRKDGGTLMAKYRRQDLVDMEPGAEVTGGEETARGEKVLTITCEGMILFGEETVKVTGSDTVRVTGKKKKGLDAFLAGILDTVLPLDDEVGVAGGEDSATTISATPTPGQEQGRNHGQLKKGNGDAACTGDCSAAAPPASQGNGEKTGTTTDNSVTGSQGNGNKAGTSDDDSVTGSRDNGNRGNGNGNMADAGNDNGGGNSNRPEKEKEKGSSNGKK